MRVGVYNRWLATLGGGEKHSLAIAEYLARSHHVEVISHSVVSKDDAGYRLNLDLSNVHFVSIPTLPPSEITPLSAEYDFFINASYLDSFPSFADRSALLIYFPSPLETKQRMRIRRDFAKMLKSWLQIPAPIEGVIHIERDGVYSRILAGSPLRFRMPSSSVRYSVRFGLVPVTQDLLGVEIFVNGAKVDERLLSDPGQWAQFDIEMPMSSRKRFHELAIVGVNTQGEKVTSAIHLLNVRDLTLDLLRYKMYHRIARGALPQVGMKLLHLPAGQPSILDSVDTYDIIWANSSYTSKWIQRYWGRRSEVLYPPVDVDSYVPSKKKSKILSVGRFFAGSHNKKHLIMVNAFRKMVNDGLRGWELHLVGGSTPGDEHQTYLQKVKDQSKGYPIFIHSDMSFGDLTQLYGESTIYWHAAGYGEDEVKNPARFEHFGITTVEAMAAGCVPVVIARGGQPEIVEHGKNGYLWKAPDELVQITWDLIHDQNQQDRMSGRAQKRSKFYDQQRFEHRLQKSINRLGIG